MSDSDKNNSRTLRSRAWFDNPDNPDMTALYLERYLNYGLSVDELQGNKPIIAIVQTGSDLSPCNRHHLILAQRVRDGIIAAGGIPLEFPTHPIQETGKRPTAALDRNLSYLSMVESLHGYPIDGAVLTIGCDKTTPAALMAAATVNLPAICLSVGPMLNGWFEGKRAGSGTIIWKARELLAAGEIDYAGFIKMVSASAPSPGYCNTMGTATTMNSLAEALGMSLPGSAAIPAPHRDRSQCAYETGKAIVEMVWADRKPSDIMTKAAFLNAIRVNSAIGGSTNAPIHLNAVARHMGVDLTLADWEAHGQQIPLLVNLQPAGEYLGEDYHRAGGVPAVMGELFRAGLLEGSAMTANGKTVADNIGEAVTSDDDVITPFENPIKQNAGLMVLSGNLFDAAVMKLSVISPDFEARYLSGSDASEAFEGVAHVFEGPEDYHQRIDDPDTGITDQSVLIMRGAGPIAYPGSAEVVNMRPPAALIKAGVTSLPCIGDGRQSGTSASPSIVNAAPEAALGGGLALVRTGDRVRIDLRNRRIDMLVDEAEIERRLADVAETCARLTPQSETPWQEIYRAYVGQLDTGMVLENAVKYQHIAQKQPVPRDSH